MKKLGLICLVLLCGCAMFGEKIAFDLVNEQYRFVYRKVTSCQQLRTESFDVFYKEKNQNCLKTNLQDISHNLKNLDKETITFQKIELTNKIINVYKKLQKCQVSEHHSFENDTIPYAYYDEVYNICKDSDYFSEEDILRITDDYEKLKKQQKQQEEKIKEIYREWEQLNKTYEKEEKYKRYNKLVVGSDQNPILRKMKRVAPEFMNAEIDGCPLVFFIQVHKDLLHNMYSDLADADNYHFSHPKQNTLLLEIGDWKYTFVKDKNNEIYIPVMTVNLETSKSPIDNHIFAESICNKYGSSEKEFQDNLKFLNLLRTISLLEVGN